MSLRASGSFDPRVRGRGEGFYFGRRVTITSSDPRSVRARVRGTRVYDVTLDLSDKLEASCTCPYDDLCKHIWATLRTAEASSSAFPELRGATTPLVVWPRRSRVLADQPSAGTLRARVLADQPSAGTLRARVLADQPSAGTLRLSPALRSGARAATGWASIVDDVAQPDVAPHAAQAPAPLELGYLVDVAGSLSGRGVVLAVVARRSAESAAPWAPYPLDAPPRGLDREDASNLLALRGVTRSPEHAHASGPLTSVVLSLAEWDALLPRLAARGRLRLRRSGGAVDDAPILIDEGPPYRLRVRATEVDPGRRDSAWRVAGVLRRGEDEIPLADCDLVGAGVVIARGKAATLVDDGSTPWIRELRRLGSFVVPDEDRGAFLVRVFSLPSAPDLELPEKWKIAVESVPPVPVLGIRLGPVASNAGPVFGEPRFAYGDVETAPNAARSLLFDAGGWRLLRRDVALEAAQLERLVATGFAPPDPRRGIETGYVIARRRFPAAAHALHAAGWRLEASGKALRRPGAVSMKVSSGIDWFDLSAKADFGGIMADLPTLLLALRRGETMILLGDGTLGLLPEEWLERYGMLADLGEAKDGLLRFKRSQATLLDLLLGELPGVDVDATYAEVREALRKGASVGPVDPPKSFEGTLRPYQREGLGWLEYLERLGLGGCLADDMGLGKTVQVLAFLAARKARAPKRKKGNRASRGPHRPTLVVAPRSLIFNWASEARRFAPKLSILDHTGPGRLPPGDHFGDHDLVITTYGTLRKDAEALAKVPFASVILDEAQAIKNDQTDTAKAARLLSAPHRLALSGTPVENHLGELGSLFEFLNPGMLGPRSKLTANLSPESVSVVARALRPFILRRTKTQVAKDLPARQEETLTCVLEGAERRRYDELRAHYRDALRKRVKEEGMARSKIQILEALLRLRQAACHPGLLDPKRKNASSAKLDALFGELENLRETGQKALVFSQFTKLLAIVRDRLDTDGVTYEYLDGRTRDRAARVERFQTDPACGIFLVSLKAGGLGLNLTAAEYVFLLDPWWNPAVEAQAIDRAHRIGQQRPVFAYRLLAKDTIEERIAELQQTKKKLAESIIEGEGGMLRQLTLADLEALLA